MVGANAEEPAKNAEGAEKGAEERAEKNAENRAKISRKISIFYKMVSILYKIDIQAVFVTIAFMIFIGLCSLAGEYCIRRWRQR